MKCRSCNSEKILDVLDLGLQPWCNDFLPRGENAQKYPLRLVFCSDCSLVQLDFTIKKEIMFSKHTYVSGTTKTLTQHFFNLAQENKYQFNLQYDDLIVDIGGNDGTQLQQYKKLGFENLLNVESATNISHLSVQSGIRTVNAYFNEDLVNKIIKSNPGIRAKIINASGVFFHLEELHSVIRGVKKLLDDEGIFIIQFMYLKDIVQNIAFDAIYHEHLCYYTLESLKNLLDPYELDIIDAYDHPIHGGSMMVKLVHRTSYKNIPTARYIAEILKENVFFNGTSNKQNYEEVYKKLQEFSTIVQNKKSQIKNYLLEFKKLNKKIYGYGSPAKGTTLLNYCEIDNSILDKLVEINTLKVGLFTPGTNIPIALEMSTDLPDYYFLLSWNFADEILAKNSDIIGKGVQFIIPLPDVRIV